MAPKCNCITSLPLCLMVPPFFVHEGCTWSHIDFTKKFTSLYWLSRTLPLESNCFCAFVYFCVLLILFGTFGYFWGHLDNFGTFGYFWVVWVLLNAFVYFCVLLVLFWYFCVLLGNFWVLLGSFEYFWVLLCTFVYLCVLLVLFGAFEYFWGHLDNYH